MTIRYIDYVLRCGRVFERAEHAILVSLANNANDSGFARPSEGEIAWNSSLSVRHVGRTLKTLKWLGVIEIIAGGGRRTNRYWLNTSLLEQMAAEFTRVKKKALQDGVDRYAEMDCVAGHIRTQMEASARQQQAFNADTLSGQTAYGVHEQHPVNGKCPSSTDMQSSLRGHHAGSADAVSASTGHHVHRTFNEPFNKPSWPPLMEPMQIDVSARGGDSCIDAPHQKDRAMRIGELAIALGMTDFQLMRKAGDPNSADQLAKDVAADKINLDEVRRLLAGSTVGEEDGDTDPLEAQK